MSVPGAIAVVLIAFVIAGLLGIVLGSGSDQSRPTNRERLLSKAQVPPKLPKYEPGSGWSSLPSPPPPGEPTVESEEGSEGSVATESSGIVYTPTPSEGASSSGRPHGIKISGGGCSC
jgi:hypothetical protein